MRLVAVGLGLAPFVVIELGLRWIGAPIAEAVDDDPLVNLEQLQPLFELNRQHGRWEIPEDRSNFFRPPRSQPRNLRERSASSCSGDRRFKVAHLPPKRPFRLGCNSGWRLLRPISTSK